MTRSTFALIGVLLLTVGCGGKNSPTSPTAQPQPQTPTPTPPATPTPPPPPTPPAPANLTLSSSTTRVSWQRTPSTGFASCIAANRDNLWRWEVTITETAGVPVTLTRAIMRADGQVLQEDTISVAIPARGSVTRTPFQCWTQDSGHVAQVSYSGTDANGNPVSVTSGNIELLRR